MEGVLQRRCAEILKKHDVNHYSTYLTLKALVIERFNSTLKNNMWKMFTLNGNYKWIDELQHLLSDYNALKHRTIGMRPADVTLAIAEKLLDTVYSMIKIDKIQSRRFGTREQVQDDF